MSFKTISTISQEQKTRSTARMDDVIMLFALLYKLGLITPVTGFLPPGPPEIMIKNPPITMIKTASMVILHKMKLYTFKSNINTSASSHRLPDAIPQGTSGLGAKHL